jgi:hypothetical protein
LASLYNPDFSIVRLNYEPEFVISARHDLMTSTFGLFLSFISVLSDVLRASRMDALAESTVVLSRRSIINEIFGCLKKQKLNL